ncbi:hypothetical protein [Yersinia aleksiciae]|uniref:hypothetical protein n=1 Tax=Yersinia aleksiciae TaxID=263819 RepID=UPI0011A393F9|nr:hypothetical protein [Yersinia aleksiciae]
MKGVMFSKLVVCFLMFFSNLALATGGFSVFYLNNERFHRIYQVSNHQGEIAYKDEIGRHLGSSSKKSDGSLSYRDKIGLLIGSSSTDSHGKTRYIDMIGNQIGSSVMDSDGGIVYKNKQGDVVAVASAD